MDQNILNLGAIGIIFVFAVKEFFSYLKAKKLENGTPGTNGGPTFNQAIFQELQKMNSNHLHSIKEAIETGNREIVAAINSGNLKMIELLGEIKGRQER